MQYVIIIIIIIILILSLEKQPLFSEVNTRSGRVRVLYVVEFCFSMLLNNKYIYIQKKKKKKLSQ